jgi:hypothetical protein
MLFSHKPHSVVKIPVFIVLFYSRIDFLLKNTKGNICCPILPKMHYEILSCGIPWLTTAHSWPHHTLQILKDAQWYVHNLILNNKCNYLIFHSLTHADIYSSGIHLISAVTASRKTGNPVQ